MEYFKLLGARYVYKNAGTQRVYIYARNKFAFGVVFIWAPGQIS